ncbi:MAG TPA: efflux RND transporter periplasmic adaptor subunit, partial [Candidatus Caenarcaniphilales bacterium]
MQLPLIGKVEQPRRWMIGLAAASALILAAATYFIVERTKPSINLSELTVPVQSQDLTVRITASGSVVPVQSVNLSPKAAGRLAQLYVEQGDRVQQGQVVARMDNAEIQAQLAQAQARLNQVQARLAEAQAGTRPEDIAQARAQVEAARAQVNLTSIRASRYQYLAQQGAEARDRLDEVLTDDRRAKASLREVQRKLEQLQRGTRSEEVARIEAEVAEARQALTQSQNGPRPEAIAQAKAEVAAARGELQSVQVQQQDTSIRAPFAGIVTQKYATEGAFVTPTTSASTNTSATSTSIVAIARGLEVLAEVPEADIGQIKPGQLVEIVADAYPDQVFKGRVRLVAPEAVVEQNVTSFQVRVALETGKAQLRSGMNADVTFLGNKLDDALVVPTVAIATQKGQTGVFIPNSQDKPQ